MTATIGRMVSPVRREARPFLYLDPKPTAGVTPRIEVRDLELLNRAVGNRTPALVRSLVNYTIELRNQQNQRAGFNQPIVLSVLNRRRRSARAWIQAVLSGNTDRATLHAFTRTWMPQMAGTGPDIVRASGSGRRCIEFLRGAITALIFDRPANNLIPHARALHALETVLGVHLQAFRDAVEEGLSSRRV